MANEPRRETEDSDNSNQAATSCHARRMFVASTLAGAGMLASSLGTRATVSAAEPASPKDQEVAGQRLHRALRPPGAPAADIGYSPAILAAGQRMLFISCQCPEDVHADMEAQIRQTFQRIGLLLEAADATFANVVLIRSYWVHLARDLPIFRKVRREFLIEPYPASTAVGTPELAIPGLELEIEAIALL
jgi:enamine deaminase RidA (YjgF/YER057c/UK114 family)